MVPYLKSVVYGEPAAESLLSVSELGVPTSVDLVRSDPAHMVTSFTTGHIGLFNMETRQLVLKLESAGTPGKSTHQSQSRFGI